MKLKCAERADIVDLVCICFYDLCFFAGLPVLRFECELVGFSHFVHTHTHTPSHTLPHTPTTHTEPTHAQAHTDTHTPPHRHPHLHRTHTQTYTHTPVPNTYHFLDCFWEHLPHLLCDEPNMSFHGLTTHPLGSRVLVLVAVELKITNVVQLC